MQRTEVMADFKKMYFELFAEIAKAIEILEEALLKTEQILFDVGGTSADPGVEE